MRKAIVLFFGFMLSFGLSAQTDTLNNELPQNAVQDDALISLENVQSESDTTQKKHSPRIAAVLSSVVPGSGQIYNGSWWKTPIVYGGFAGLGYGLYFYQDYYKSFKKAYNDYRNPFLEKGLTPPTDTVLTVRGESGYSPVNVQQGRDYYRKYRDLCIFGIGFWYIINILDAYVEAHLFEFDVSDDLTIRCEPFLYHEPMQSAAKAALPSGVRVSLRF